MLARQLLGVASSDPQWRCLDRLWQLESQWDHTAQNPRSSAYGIPQLLNLAPGTPIDEQITRGLTYLAHRYENPCDALRHHHRHGWY